MGKDDWNALLGWGDDEINDLRFVGFSYLKQGHYETALKIFEALLIICDEELYDLQTTGAILLQMGDGQKALSLFEKALDIDPNHSITRANKAKSLILLGREKEALSEAALIKDDPDDSVSSSAQAIIMAYKSVE